MDQGDAEIQPPLHPAGERIDTVVGPFGEAHCRQHLRDSPPQSGPLDPIQTAEEARFSRAVSSP